MVNYDMPLWHRKGPLEQGISMDLGELGSTICLEREG